MKTTLMQGSNVYNKTSMVNLVVDVGRELSVKYFT